MSSPGRQLLEARPSQWVELHRQHWPIERVAFQDAVGRVLSSTLRGDAVVIDDSAEGPAHVELRAMVPSDRALLDLQVPGNDDDGNPATKGVDLTALLLPRSVRADSTWVMSPLSSKSWVELSDLDAVVCALLLAPVMADLAAIFRLRAGRGPQSEKGKTDELTRCRQAHEALGLPSDLIRPLLDPTLGRHEVIAARQALILSWSEHPDDVGARAMALLCARLAGAYYAKARKDGTVQEARVMNTKTKPLLDVTLRTWDSLVSYLGEGLSTADAQPIAVPEVALPPQPPEPIAERMGVLQEWWRLYDLRQAAQQPENTSLAGLVPPLWDTDPGEGYGHRPVPDLYRSLLPPELVERVEQLWGTGILVRHPGVLIAEPHPFVRFGRLLRPAIEAWDDLASTCWSLCFAGYSRYSLDQLEEQHARVRRELEKVGAPIDLALYRQLREAGRGHDWLFEPRGFNVSVVISLSEQGDVTVGEGDDRPAPAEARPLFLTLRSIIDAHRRRWLDDHLDHMLDAVWRDDIGRAGRAYWSRLRGKGSALTVKQALPDVLEAAERWFNADYGALARTIGLPGPIGESPLPTDRRLPLDLPQLHHEVAAILGGSVRAGELDPREAIYRVSQLAARSDDILVYWQAAGTAPPRSAIFGPNYSWLFAQVFGCEVEDGYKLVLAATREALARSGHPAALELEIV